ncbi:hypothetical protein AWC38_SpisGene23673 [Stylophora pistillata]|uniref:Uncharacterized protein n=1 Tax=Stylophora pistillata TaxID=50429 RepID=A0A2B4R5F5_STYPI|nr:hypothetical protein AWC38_SpisGene23673 [Stylophora pistillata]
MQLSSLKSITRDNVIFEEATTNQHGHERINIKIKHTKTAAGPLVIASPFQFSFGVQPNFNKSGDVVSYYTLPTPLWNGSGEPTQKEFAFYEALKELKHICYQYLDEVYGVDVAESIKFPLVEKEGKAPVLYPRLMYSQKSAMVKITSLKDINKENVIFEEQETGSKYNIHIKIKAKHACGETGPLVIVSPFLYSYLQQNLSVDGVIKGYTMPVFLSPHNLQEKLFYNALKELKNLCYEHIDEFSGKEEAEVMKFPMVEEKEEDDDDDDDDDDTYSHFYPKLMYSESIQKIHTLFYTKDKTKVEPLDYLGRECQVKMAIVIDSIVLIDDKFSVQMLLHDVYVKRTLFSKKYYTTFDVSDGGIVKFNLEELKKLSPPPSWPTAFLSDFKEPPSPKLFTVGWPSIEKQLLKKREEEVEEEKKEGEADQLASSADIENVTDNLMQLDKEEGQEGDSKEEDQKGDSEEEDQDEVSDIHFFISYAQIHKLIAHKETMNLLTKKQNKALYTALQSGDDLLIHLTQRQCFGGFISTLPTNVGHLTSL